jgi:hypothetical protein
MAKKKKAQFKENLQKRIPQAKGRDLLGAKAEELRSLRKRGWPASPVWTATGFTSSYTGITPPTERKNKVKVKITPAAAKRRKATDALIASNKSTPAEKAKRVAAFKAKSKKKKGKK